jgi:hypothetical protein
MRRFASSIIISKRAFMRGLTVVEDPRVGLFRYIQSDSSVPVYFVVPQ